MGLFGRQSKPREKIHALDLGPGTVPHGGVPTICPQNLSAVSPDADHLRMRFARLFEDDKAGAMNFTTSHAAATTDQIRPYLSQLFASEDHLMPFSPVLTPKCDDCTEPRINRAAIISDTETVGDLFLGKPLAPNYPDAAKPCQASAEHLKWSIPSPSKSGSRSLKSPISSERRQQLVARTNSLSKLVRRASGFKRSNSTRVSKSQNEDSSPADKNSNASKIKLSTPEPHSMNNDVEKPLPFKSQTDVKPVQKPDSTQHCGPGFSLSPTTPDIEGFPKRKPRTSNIEMNTATEEHPTKLNSGTSTAENANFADVASGGQKLFEDGIASRRSASSQRISRDIWSRAASNEYSDDNFGVEAATTIDFLPPETSGYNDKHNNSPSSLQESVGAKSGEAGKVGRVNSNVAEAIKLEQKNQEIYSAVHPTVRADDSDQQPRRPPPLFSASTESDTTGDSDKPDEPCMVDAFGLNGELQTGGFRITAEGMVGKPERTTRKDSDDDDGSRAGAPQSLAKVNVIRSLNEFRKGPTLGVGAAGRVYLAIHEPTGRSMAIKVVNVFDEGKRNQLLKELDTLSTHVSRFLVCFHGAFYDGTGAVHIALEYMDAGCLSSTIQKFGPIPEAVTRMIATDCLRALRFLHRHNVLHRDFKTANILLSRRQLCAKVSDFGLARDLDEGVSKVDTFVGTLAYMSPERLQGSKYTYAADIWALGISVAECLLGCYPFDRPQSYFDFIDASMSKDVLSRIVASRQRLSAEVLDFVALCTQTDPARRPPAAVLLEHPWIHGVDRNVDLFRNWLDNLAVQKSRDASSMKSIKSIRYFLGKYKKQ